VLLKPSERLGPNGTWKVNGYETTTFTRFPGALLVALVQEDHVVGVVLLAELLVVLGGCKERKIKNQGRKNLKNF